MSISFFNTASRKKENFAPIENGKVKLYTCGPTVYDHAHIGNFRTFLFEDFLKRFLILSGYEVSHIMNLTDVDDKTIERAKDKGEDLKSLTQKFTDLFYRDTELLKILPADSYPAATDHIEIMIDLIQKLIDKNHAYRTEDGSIYFSIKSFQQYGSLARLDLTGQKQTDRVASDEYSKDSPQDFALWKAWKEEDGDVHWESPWGKGRPGWHIECSAMSMHYLGEHFDIHCGGTDNIFPHHENELAQSMAGTESKFVNVWMHSEHLLVDGGKMSKSLGNYYHVDDLIAKEISPEAIRFALLSGHYRSRLNFTLDKAADAKKAVARIREFKDRLESFEDDQKSEQPGLPKEYESFMAALDDDLNIPNALAVFFDWLRKMNVKMDDGNAAKDEISEGLHFLQKFNFVFQVISGAESVPKGILDLSEEREAARKKKNWEESDRLRDEISKNGWVVEDTPAGPKLKKI